MMISSPAVRLEIVLLEMREDDSDDAVRLRQAYSANNVNAGNQSITVSRGRQYVVFTAVKIRVTKTPDRVNLSSIWYTNGSCTNNTPSK